MKKVLFCVLFAQLSFAQLSKNLGDFNTVKVFDKLKVTLISSNETKAVINGNRQDEVEFVNKNGDLKIRMPFPKLLAGNNISIELYFKNIDGIAASEGASVSSQSVFEGTIFDLSVKEGAQLDLEFDGTKKLNVKAVSGGIIDLKGTVVNQDVVIMSGGVFNAKNLKSSQATINVSAGGTAEINASTLVDAKVKAGGTIYIYGKPEQINKRTILGGTILEKK